MFYLDKFVLIEKLSKDGFSHNQSKALLNSLSGLLKTNLLAQQQKLLLKNQYEQNLLSYKSQLHTLKIEWTTLRKSETLNLQSQLSLSQKDLEFQQLKWREDFSILKSSLMNDMTQKRGEVKEELFKNEGRVIELGHQLTLAVSGIKSRIESMKLQLMSQYAPIIAAGTAGCVIFLATFY